MKKTNGPGKGKPMMKDVKPMGIAKPVGPKNRFGDEMEVVTPKRNTIRKAVGVEAKANRKIAGWEQKTADKVGKLEKKASSFEAAGKPFKASVASSRAALAKESMKRVKSNISNQTKTKVDRIKNMTKNKQERESVVKKAKMGNMMTPEKLERRRNVRATIGTAAGAAAFYGGMTLKALKNKNK